MSTAASECFGVLSCLLEAVQTNEDPSAFANSCASHSGWITPKISAAVNFLRQILRSKVGLLVVIRVEFLVVQATIKGIQSFPLTAILVVKLKSRKNFERGGLISFHVGITPPQLVIWSLFVNGT